MVTAASVVVCALSLLGRSATALPPITLVDAPPPGISRQAEGFTADGRIYLVTGTGTFRLAIATAERRQPRCGDRVALARIASVIVHEEWHVRHGDDEGPAYDAQVMALVYLGYAPDTPIVGSVRAARRAVLLAQQAAKKARPDTVVAAATP